MKVRVWYVPVAGAVATVIACGDGGDDEPLGSGGDGQSVAGNASGTAGTNRGGNGGTGNSGGKGNSGGTGNSGGSGGDGGDATAGADPGASGGGGNGGDGGDGAGTSAGAGGALEPGCGDGSFMAGESCDDGNTRAEDGCDPRCAIEPGWRCAGEPSRCEPSCGDGLVVGGEACDDDGAAEGDGCSSACRIERGWACSGQPSICEPRCGDGIILGPAETCDDGLLDAGDGCSATCRLEPGWVCSGEPSRCAATCGDGNASGGEACDDGNATDGDCCSANCALEAGCEIELNDAPLSANDFFAIASEGRVRGAIAPATDRDFFALTVPRRADLRIESFDRSGVTCNVIDTLIRFYDTDGVTELGRNDDSGLSACSLLDPSVDAAVRRLDPGTYYVLFTPFGSLSVPGYSLAASFSALCGNGVREGSEQCDGTAGCDDHCEFSACGDGAVSGGETCDDGNAAQGDGCSESCAFEGLLAELEPNGTIMDAALVPMLGGRGLAHGSIAPVNERDLFAFELSSDAVVRLETFGRTAHDCRTDTALRLFDSTGVPLHVDDNTGIQSCSALTVSLASGRYYVQVEEAGNNRVIPDYFLDLRVLGAGVGEIEPNDARVFAEPLVGTDVYVSGSSQDNNFDWFQITVPEGRSLRAELIEGGATACSSPAVFARLALHDEQRQLRLSIGNGRGFCALIDGTGSEPLDREAHALPAGTYYLQVYSDAPFDYRLVVAIR